MTCTHYTLFERFFKLNIAHLSCVDCLQDQKVKWHATPFEERLNKALSEEKHLSQRYC